MFTYLNTTSQKTSEYKSTVLIYYDELTREHMVIFVISVISIIYSILITNNIFGPNFTHNPVTAAPLQRNISEMYDTQEIT